MSLSHYGRIHLIRKLLPLLQNSPAPRRILSVLAGGAERRLMASDMHLHHSYATLAAIDHMTSLHTLALARLAGENPNICFIHAHPGFVGTDIVSDAFAGPADAERGAMTLTSLRGAAARFLGSTLLAPLFKAFLSMSVEESGQRHVFHATSDRYSCAAEQQRGHADNNPVNGLYLVDSRGEPNANWKLLRQWMGDGTAEEAWDHTMHVISKSTTPKEKLGQQ